MKTRVRTPVLRYDPSLEHNKENTLKNNTIESHHHSIKISVNGTCLM